MPRYELDGQVAIVTGASRGIGLAIARRLAQEGADVAVSDIDRYGVSKVAPEIRSLGRRCIAIGADVSKKAQAEAMVAETKSTLGKVDILVNNAGVAIMGPLMETDEVSWDRVQNVNVKGVLFSTQAAAKEMMARRSGRIINMASGAGKMAPARELGLGAYSVSKFAVVGLTKSFANELAPYGILVNCVCPGIVDTPMWDKIDLETAEREHVPMGSVKAKNVATIPVGRIQLPEDVANVVAFLASSDASYITGQSVDASGGLTPV